MLWQSKYLVKAGYRKIARECSSQPFRKLSEMEMASCEELGSSTPVSKHLMLPKSHTRVLVFQRDYLHTRCGKPESQISPVSYDQLQKVREHIVRWLRCEAKDVKTGDSGDVVCFRRMWCTVEKTNVELLTAACVTAVLFIP